MKYVWVVEGGEYSDYRVAGVFSKKEHAVRANKALSTKLEVAKWPLDPCVKELLQGYKKYSVVMLRDGTTEDVRLELYTYNFVDSVFLWKRTEVPAYKGKGIPDALSAIVWAKDEKHAVKIVNEKRTEMIANGKWEVK